MPLDGCFGSSYLDQCIFRVSNPTSNGLVATSFCIYCKISFFSRVLLPRNGCDTSHAFFICGLWWSGCVHQPKIFTTCSVFCLFVRHPNKVQILNLLCKLISGHLLAQESLTNNVIWCWFHVISEWWCYLFLCLLV